MKITLTIGGTNFHPYAERGGISLSYVTRQNRSIVTLDGTLIESGVQKRQIDFSAVTLKDTTYASLLSALGSQGSTKTVVVNDGTSYSGTFYVRSVKAAAEVVEAGVTYFSGFSFTLEEK